MKQFKTNIKCDACVVKVTPALNAIAGESNWSVNLKDPQRTLSLPDDVTADQVKKSLQQVGYTAEPAE